MTVDGSKNFSKLQVLEGVLEECARFNQKFKNICALAEYCALRVNEKERHGGRGGQDINTDCLPDVVGLKKPMHYRSLLRKNSSYRRLLDLWMHSNCGAHLSVEHARIKELEYKLLRAANELNTIKGLYERQLESSALLKDKTSPQNLADDAFAIVEILLDRFASDIVLEGGAVKERSVVRTVYVNANLMKPYLEWLGDEL
jgi:hypothetical protein